MRLCFDIEANALLEDVSKVWCIVAQDLDTNEVHSFNPDSLMDGLQLLSKASLLVAHNGYGYDFPVLHKLHGWKPSSHTETIDTFVLASLCHLDMKEKDFDSGRPHIAALAGSHSLEAWGVRLGTHKGTYGKQENAWDAFTPEMLRYCQRDVEVNVKLYKHLCRSLPPKQAIDLEMDVARRAEECNRRGWNFDVEAAHSLLTRLKERQEELRKELVAIFPIPSEEMKTPAYYTLTGEGIREQRFPTKGEADKWRKGQGLKPKQVKIVPGPPKKRIIEFNPNSTKQVADQLYQRYQWVPPDLTDKGLELMESGQREFEDLVLEYPKITEEILSTLRFPEVPQLIEYQMLTKRISMLETGESGWLKRVSKDGRLRYRIVSLGTITGRVAHKSPNLGQVTGVGKAYGDECRSLFCASEGYVQVGIDLSGIEARLLAHYLYQYDKGKYADLILNGDIHQHNADNVGVSRSAAKGLSYAHMYGAAATKLGRMAVSASDSYEEQYQDAFKRFQRKYPVNEASKRAYKSVGTVVKSKLEEGITGLTQLLTDVKIAAQRGYLSPLDGRRIPVRSEHSALNTLLQGSAAIVAKRWLSSSIRAARRKRLDSHMLIFSHDEIQSDVRPEHVDQHIDIFLKGIKYTEKFYKIKIALDGEAKVGKNWFETH